VILADTSVWVDHLRRSSPDLARLLEGGEVLIHSFVIGELACGTLRNRREILDLLAGLPAATVATDDEVLHFIDERRLAGKGIGWVDAHLLASVTLTPEARLWTRDRRLRVIAEHFSLSFAP
jgi:predicted nucleic acid-binding protein